jgi:hypothetical protein
VRTTRQSKVPPDEVIKRDFETGTVQPGPGMAPEKPPAANELEYAAKHGPNAAKPAGKQDPGKPSGGCGCG